MQWIWKSVGPANTLTSNPLWPDMTFAPGTQSQFTHSSTLPSRTVSQLVCVCVVLLWDNKGRWKWQTIWKGQTLLWWFHRENMQQTVQRPPTNLMRPRWFEIQLVQLKTTINLQQTSKWVYKKVQVKIKQCLNPLNQFVFNASEIPITSNYSLYYPKNHPQHSGNHIAKALTTILINN